MNMCIKFVLIIVMVLAYSTAQQTYLTILEYADNKCKMVVASFSFPLDQCITQSDVSSMTITSRSIGTFTLYQYGSTDCSGNGLPTRIPYTVDAGCSAMYAAGFSFSGLYYTVDINMGINTAASALQITSSLGAGAVIASYQDSGCTLQSTKAGVTTNGLPGEVSFLANGQCGVNPFTLQSYFKNTCSGVGALKGSLNYYTDNKCTNLIPHPTTSTTSDYTISTRNLCSPVIPTVTNVGTYVPIFGLYAQGYCQGIQSAAPTMTPTVSNLVVVNAMQDLGCSGCLMSGWGTGGALATFIAAFDLAMSTAIYNSLNMAAYGGFVNVTGLTQKTTTRRQLLAPTLTVAYTVRMNNPAVTATSIRSTLTSANTLTTIGATMSVVAASSVTAAAPTLIITGVGANTPTAAPSVSVPSLFSSPSSVLVFALAVSICGSAAICCCVIVVILITRLYKRTTTHDIAPVTIHPVDELMTN